MAEHVATTDLRFNPKELRAKYREERDKRLRADGNDQYFEVTGDFSHYVDDPYISAPLAREPVGRAVRRGTAAPRLARARTSFFFSPETSQIHGFTWFPEPVPVVASVLEAIPRISFSFKGSYRHTDR